MKSALVKLMPQWARTLWFNVKEFIFLKMQPDRAARFREIYAGNHWRNAESRSGFGSTITATEKIRFELGILISSSGVCSILDIPCGDFNWMKLVSFDGQYTGADIVENLIEENQKRYGSPKRVFRRLDLVADRLPQTELVICRECLNHLSLAECKVGLDNLAEAATRLLVVTHHPEITRNVDQETSFRFRPLNLTIAPFAFRQPDRLIEDFGSGELRYLAVWDIRAAPIVRTT